MNWLQNGVYLSSDSVLPAVLHPLPYHNQLTATAYLPYNDRVDRQAPPCPTCSIMILQIDHHVLPAVPSPSSTCAEKVRARTREVTFSEGKTKEV